MIFLYEPFNPNLVKEILYHDFHGFIKNDIDKLPKYLQELIRCNDWIINYLRGNCKYLGNYEVILSKLNELNQEIIIKDVHTWVKLLELVKLLPNTKHVVIVRDFEEVKEGFLQWYRQRTLKKILYLMMRFKINSVKSRLFDRKTGIGVKLFYKALFGKDVDPLKNEKVFSKYLEDIYMKYLEIVDDVKKCRNVYVIEFKKLISNNIDLNQLIT